MALRIGSLKAYFIQIGQNTMKDTGISCSILVQVMLCIVKLSGTLTVI